MSYPLLHCICRYKEDSDHIYRLQLVRFETVELSRQLQASRSKQLEASSKEHDMDEDIAEDWEPPETETNQEEASNSAQECVDQQQTIPRC